MSMYRAIIDPALANYLLASIYPLAEFMAHEEFEMRLTPIIAAISLVALAPFPASAQGPSTAGARMASEAERAGDRADAKADLADQWKDGDRMVTEGNRMVRRAERRMASFAQDASKYQARADRATADGAKAEASLAEGRRMIEAGGRLKVQAEARFPLVPAA